MLAVAVVLVQVHLELHHRAAAQQVLLEVLTQAVAVVLVQVQVLVEKTAVQVLS
jgi:hypothetical protein